MAMSDNTGITWALDIKDSNVARRHSAAEDSTRPQGAAESTSRLLSSTGSSGDGDTDQQTPTALRTPTADDVSEFINQSNVRAKDHTPAVQDVSASETDTTITGAPANAFPHPTTIQIDGTNPDPVPSSSTQKTSSSSLKSMSERETDVGGRFVNRALSSRSSYSQIRPRRMSHAKSASTSQPASRRQMNVDHPVYPDQSFASLQAQFNAVRPVPPLRTRSSNPGQNVQYNDINTSPKHMRDRQLLPPGIRTADNTPMSSPGLFTPLRNPSASSADAAVDGPKLHHLQTPKETHTAEIEHDTFSGNKFINNYEVVKELGRGEHGKVKLGRDIERDTFVAVKIVPRYSAKRRLGRLGAPEDRTKREVAILKKARHPNVVSLLEVIDDPNKNKVYLILEYVDRGEIKWRKRGVREILAVNNARFEQAKAGIKLGTEVAERDAFNVKQAQRRHEQQEKARAAHLANDPNWSLEYGGDTDEEEGFSDVSRTGSRQFMESGNPSRTNSHDDFVVQPESALAGSMYGAYTSDAYRGRKFSIATSAVSHMSSEFNFDETDDERSYVPAMTLEEARRAFQDTLLGLEFLHFIGIIHRDIKPANLLVAGSGAVKISDFGVSYFGRPTSEEDPDNRLEEKDAFALDDEKELARSVGTPAFWAPELCYEDPSMFEEKNGPKITGALDLWALGITLYCMVYARLPFYANEEMGLHEAVCRAEVFLPRTRLVPVDTTKDLPTANTHHPINSNKRIDYELKFEVVPDPVRDLIGKLLVKDPVKRMTIAQAKEHPWVVEGMVDPTQWIKGPDLEKEGKTKIFEVDEKEMSHAVVRRNIIERALNTAGRIAGSILGRRDTRKRASSTATSASQSSESVVSPSGSNASTVGRADKIRESRRTSLRGDELLTALKASHNNSEHPLAQSQSASPDTSDQRSYFDETPDQANAASTICTPSEAERRPRAPERAISGISTAESVRTIKASQYMQRPPIPGHLHSFDTPTTTEPTLKTKVEGLWEGTTRTLARLASRDRRSWRDDHSPSSSRSTSESDARAFPSLAVSTASAAGAIQTPDALRTEPSPSDVAALISSQGQSPTAPRRQSIFQAPASTEAAFEQAQDINQRRLIMEAQVQAEAAAAAASRPQSQPQDDECPPSPDDITFLERQRSVIPASSSQSELDGLRQTAPSASTIASSLEDYGNSSVSQSMSNPSFGAISGASSPPGDGFLSAEYKDLRHGLPTLFDHDSEPAFMRTADTITEHGRPTTAVAMGKALEDRDYGAYENDGDDEDDDDDDSDDGILMLSTAKKI